MTTRIIEALKDKQLFVKCSRPAFVLYALFSAISIAASQMLLVTTVVVWIISLGYWGFSERGNTYWPLNTVKRESDKTATRLLWAVGMWWFLAVAALFLGYSFSGAMSETLKTLVYLAIPFCFYSALTAGQFEADYLLKYLRILSFVFVISLCLAALHSILEPAVGEDYLPGLPGYLTESGQHVLILPLIFCFLLTAPKEESSASVLKLVSLAVLFFLSAVFFVWPELVRFFEPSTTRAGVGFVIVALLMMFTLEAKKSLSLLLVGGRCSELFLALAAGLVFSASFINLKRGPWAAIVIELVILGFFISKRLVIYTVVVGALVILGLAPARERLSSAADHFFADGGRASMWSMGVDIVGRFPLGLGLDNAEFMREIDSTLPESHKHMHNTLLNMAVESGWLGMAAYLWWMILITLLGFRIYLRLSKHSSKQVKEAGNLALALGISLVGWHIGGLTEYNFGDGEVRMIVLVMMGMLLTLQALSDEFASGDSP